MRVLILTNLYPNPRQPHRAPFNRQQFAALAEAHDVRVVAPIAWTGELWARTNEEIATIPLGRTIVRDGLVAYHPRYVFPPRMLRGTYGRCFARSARPMFQMLVREFRPDVVLGCWAYPDGWAAVRLAREFGLPVVLKVQGSDVLLAGQDAARSRGAAAALAGADAVVAVSRDLAERAIAMGAARDRVHVVHNGVDTTRFFPGDREVARAALGIQGIGPLFTFVGNLAPVKGLDVLLESLWRLWQRGVVFRCVLVGDGQMRATLQRDIDARGLRDHVTLVGARPLDEIPLWHRASDLLVLPSRSEGFPNVLREAAACGTPFIASRVGGVPEIAPTESMFAPGNAAALTERLMMFIQRPDQRSCTASVVPRTWGESAGDLAGVLRGAIEAARAGTRKVQ